MEFPPKKLGPNFQLFWLSLVSFHPYYVFDSAFQKNGVKFRGWRGVNGKRPVPRKYQQTPTLQPPTEPPNDEALSAILLAFFAKVLLVSFPKASVKRQRLRLDVQTTERVGFKTYLCLTPVCLIHSFFILYIYIYTNVEFRIYITTWLKKLLLHKCLLSYETTIHEYLYYSLRWIIPNHLREKTNMVRPTNLKAMISKKHNQMHWI